MPETAGQRPGRPGGGARTLAFVALVPTPVTILFPWLLSRPGFEIYRFDPGPLGLIGWLPVAAGAVVFLLGVREFVRAGSSPSPWDSSPRLLVGGPFSRSRNPLYLAIVTILAGEALLYGSITVALYAVLLWGGFHLRVVWFEEKRLRGRYGRAYEEYLRYVPRWFPHYR